MNAYLIVEEELILKAQNWTKIKIKKSYKLYKKNQTMISKFEDKRNLFNEWMKKWMYCIFKEELILKTQNWTKIKKSR